METTSREIALVAVARSPKRVRGRGDGDKPCVSGAIGRATTALLRGMWYRPDRGAISKR